MTDKKTKWETVLEFDPSSTGFVFDPQLSILGLVQDLLRQFTENCPNPKSPKQFIGAILLDPISFWHAREELYRSSQVQSAEPYILFCEHSRLYGYPCYLQGVEGVGLALKEPLAPALLRQQMAFLKEGGRGSRDGHFGYMLNDETEEEKSEEKIPGKGDLH